MSNPESVAAAEVATLQALRQTAPGEFFAGVVQSMIADNVEHVVTDSLADKHLETLHLIDGRGNYHHMYSSFDSDTRLTAFGLLIPGRALKDPYYIPLDDPSLPSFRGLVSLRHYLSNDRNVIVSNRVGSPTGPIIKQQRIRASSPDSRYSAADSPIAVQFAKDLSMARFHYPIMLPKNPIYKILDKIRTD